MHREKKEQGYGCFTKFLVVCFSIFMIIRTIIRTISLNKITYDVDDQMSDLAVQYYDANKSLISFKEINSSLLSVSAFKKEMTTNEWEPNQINDTNKVLTLNNKCQMCGTEYFNPSSNSSERDLIINYFNEISIFRLKFISNLRASNCKAKIVLFTSQRSELFHQNINKVVDNCGVTLINIDSFQQPYSDNEEISFHILIHEFLKHSRSKFDRVIVFNTLSLIVQSDPFTTYFTYNTVGVTTAGYDLQITDQLSEKIGQIDSNLGSSHFESKSPELSSTILFGSVDGILMLYGIIFSHENFKSDKIEEGVSLAAYINYFYHTGQFEKRGLNLLISYPGNFICSIDNSEKLHVLTNYYHSSPFNIRKRVFFTSRYYREKLMMFTVDHAMNPPSIITISSKEPFSVDHYMSCSNIPIHGRNIRKSRANSRMKKVHQKKD